MAPQPMRALTIVLLAAPACCFKSPAIVRITDSASRRPVVLIGTMHYNPASIAAVTATVKDVAASRGGLHAAAIELCPARWNSTIAAKWNRTYSLKRLMAEDEFQVTFETVTDCGLDDIVLADQAIEVTGRRLGSALLQTVKDLLAGPAGWRRVQTDLLTFTRELPTFAMAAADLPLLAGMPLAMARYLYQSPAAAPFIALSTASLFLAAAADEASGAHLAWEDGVVTLLLAIVLGRAVFTSLIAERNVVLARNIRDACLQPQGPRVAAVAMRTDADADAAESDGVLASGDDGGDETATVIAVLGMAHLAGVRDALLCDGFDA